MFYYIHRDCSRCFLLENKLPLFKYLLVFYPFTLTERNINSLALNSFKHNVVT